jgi:ribonuclease J
MNSAAPAPAPAPSSQPSRDNSPTARPSGEGRGPGAPRRPYNNTGPRGAPSHARPSSYGTRPRGPQQSPQGAQGPKDGPSRGRGPSSSSTGGRPGRVSRQIQRTLRRGPSSTTTTKKAADYFPELAPDNVVRVIPLGGVEEVGRNMIAVETQGEIFVLDAGFQFTSEDSSPGVDYILPNTKYLEHNMDRVKGVFITHGHLDHIGAIPFIMNRFGNPPIYTQNLSAVMIAKRQEEYPDMPAPNLIVVEPGSTHTVGKTKVFFFPVTHSIPDSMGICIQTPHGNVIATGDLKLDHENGDPVEHEKKKWGALGAQKNLLFIADSTNAERDGFSIPERRVTETLDEIIKTVKGRLIIGTFASQFDRMIHIIEAAEKYGKKIVTEGRSIRTNLEIAQKTGLLKIEKGTLITAQDMADYPPDKVVILATGAQGEEFAALMRIATKQHKYVQLSPRDTIVLSSSVIPGNEISVQKLKDNLYRNGVALIHYKSSDVHSTGHGNTGELVWINQQVNAKFFMPAYGYYSMTSCHAKAVEQAGRPRETIILADNGMVIDMIDGEKLEIHKEKVPSSPLIVDGFAIGDMQEVVIRDRQALSKDGMFVIIATVNLKTGKLRKSPDIISRGFIYLRESQELLNQARLLIKKTVEDSTRNMNPVDLDFVKNEISDVMAGYLFQQTNKAPMVIPVLIGV